MLVAGLWHLGEVIERANGEVQILIDPSHWIAPIVKNSLEFVYHWKAGKPDPVEGGQ